MASWVEIVGEALIAYWSSPLSLMVLLVFATSMGTLLYVFVTNARNAKLRVTLLTGLYALSMFFWAFVAVSLALCTVQARVVAYSRNGVPLAVFGAVVGGFALTATISLVVWRFGNAAVIRRFAPRMLHAEQRWIQEHADRLAEFEGTPPVRIGLVESDEVIALAVGGNERRILLSRGLLALLDPDETDAVVAHELMHLKHHDAEFKVFSHVLSRILFFDPFSKFFDPAVHREREYLADEMGARSIGRPATMASALLKIEGRGPAPKASWGLSIVGSGTGMFSRYPPLRERVHRLLLLSDLLGAPAHGGINR